MARIVVDLDAAWGALAEWGASAANDTCTLQVNSGSTRQQPLSKSSHHIFWCKKKVFGTRKGLFSGQDDRFVTQLETRQ